MRTRFAIVAALVLAAAPAVAEEPSASGDGASTLGKVKEATKEGAQTVRDVTKKTTRAIGHGTRDAAKAIGHGTRDAAKGVGSAIKGAWQEATGESAGK